MNRDRFAMTGYDYVLYAGLLWGWSTSWYAIKHQLGVAAPEVSVFWRFLLTAPLMFALARWQGERIRFSPRMHIGLAATGVLMFSSNFTLMYYAGGLLPSGFLAVIFSLASILNFALGMLLFGEPFQPKLAIGGLLGVLGVGALFYPQISDLGAGQASLAGLALGVAGTICFSLGNQVSSRLQKAGATVLASAAWGMLYGALWAGSVSLFRGQSFSVPMTPAYLGSMVFLILSASILAFYTFLSLVGRIGAARASYATVIFPIFALVISTFLEGYRWSVLAVLGLVLAVIGNIIVLRRD